MKGGVDLLRAEIKNCILCLNKVSQRQLLPLTCYYHVSAVLCLCYHSLSDHAVLSDCCEGGRWCVIFYRPLSACRPSPPEHDFIFTVSWKANKIQQEEAEMKVMFGVMNMFI